MLLKDLLQEYIFECEIKKYTWKTIKSYRNSNLYLINYLEQEYNITNAKEVLTTHIKQFMMFQIKKGCIAFNRYFVHAKAPILLEFSALLWYNKGNEIRAKEVFFMAEINFDNLPLQVADYIKSLQEKIEKQDTYNIPIKQDTDLQKNMTLV